MQYVMGFIIAMFIATTGVGAGTITTPLLILFLGLPATTAVTTGLVFSSAVKLVLVPSQVLRKQVSWPVLGYMLLGGLPGVLLGSFGLHHFVSAGSKRTIDGLLGIILLLTALYQILFSFRPAQERDAMQNSRFLLSGLMFPVGAEVGFSSAGAGALGVASLLSFTALDPTQVVGTDIVFGFLLSLVGSGAHLFSYSVNGDLLKHLLFGGVPGALLGTVCAPYIPKRALRYVLWAWLLVIGSQFIYRCAFAPR